MAEAEGKIFSWESPDHIRTDFLETFDFDSPHQYIRTETRELIASCPFSGLPDVGRLIIEYYPEGGRCIELKSLKYYVVSFRNVGLFQEGVTKRIYTDLKEKLLTSRLKVTTLYNTRGGFDTTCSEGEL
jgi:7-cyano-7-deazaguanine reductase